MQIVDVDFVLDGAEAEVVVLQSDPRSPVCVKTSTKSVAWLCSVALWRPVSEMPTKAPMLAIMLQIMACVIWSSPARPKSSVGRNAAKPKRPCSTTVMPNQPDFANAGSRSV